MSLIASFWTIDSARRAEIVDAFKPLQVERTQRRWGIFRSTKRETTYPWFDYLREHAREEAEFRHSGIAMTDFDLIFAQSGASIFSTGLPESDALSEHSQASVALLDECAAGAVLSRLESFDLSEEDVVRFYDADQKPLEWRSEPTSVVAAHRQLIEWCRTVEPGRLGLLMIG
jgi:hypothetical protein